MGSWLYSFEYVSPYKIYFIQRINNARGNVTHMGIETPHLLKVAVLRKDYQAVRDGSLEVGQGLTPMDSAVLKHVFQPAANNSETGEKLATPFRRDDYRRSP